MNAKIAALLVGLSFLPWPRLCFAQNKTVSSAAPAPPSVDNTLASLREAGAFVELDKQGNVLSLCLNGLGGKFTDKELKALAPLTTVEVFDASVTEMSDAGMVYIGRWKRLKSLNIVSTKVTDRGLAHLKELTKLEFLNLPSAASDECLPYLGGLSKLKVLSFMGTRVTDSGLGRLQGLEGLEALYLRTNGISQAGIANLGELPNLRGIGLPSDFSDSGFQSLRKFPKLGTLHLANFKRVTDDGLVHLRGFRNLRTLSLPSQITDAGLAHLSRLSQIETLDIRRTQATGESLENLYQMKNLRSLDLPGTITDRGLVRLRHLCSIRLLKLHGEFTDAGLDELRSLENLEFLGLYNTATTDQGIRRLKKSLSELIVDQTR